MDGAVFLADIALKKALCYLPAGLRSMTVKIFAGAACEAPPTGGAKDQENKTQVSRV